MDMEMPNANYFGQALVAAVESGAVPLSRLNDMATRVLVPMFSAGLFDGSYPAPGAWEDANVTSPAHNALARSLAAAGTVLLKNTPGLLPLRRGLSNLLVVGDACSLSPICCGTGSGAVPPPYLVSPLDGVKARAAVGGTSNVTFLRSPPNPSALNATAATAAGYEAVLLCLSSPSGEGSDRPNLSLAPLDDALAAALVAANPATIVSLQVPGAVLMPWSEGAGAILCTWFAGQEMGNALADVLWGDVNPSGRLPLTFPLREGDTPMQTPAQYPGVNGVANYSEGLNIGYRWFDSHGVQPAYPFGHGLSFTTFEYSAIRVDGTSAKPTLLVSFNVTNSGLRAGREVAQLYLTFPASAQEPPLNLRDFHATSTLSPGEVEVVSMTLLERDYSIWSEAEYAWTVVPGTYTLSAGASSRDLRLKASFDV